MRGCARAISANAFTCEYCGHQVGDDVMDVLPRETGEAADAATAAVSALAGGVEDPLERAGTSDLWTGEPLPFDDDEIAIGTARGLLDAPDRGSAVAAIGKAVETTVECPPALEDPWQMADEVPLDSGRTIPDNTGL